MTITLNFYILIDKIYLYNYNESLFYMLIKVIIHHLIKITQRTNIKLIIIKF